MANEETNAAAPVPPTVDALVDRVIALRRQYKAISEEIDAVKQRLMPPMEKIGTVATPYGTVSYVHGGISRYLNKDKIRSVLMSQLKLSMEAAEQIIQAGMADKVLSSYIKVYTEA